MKSRIDIEIEFFLRLDWYSDLGEIVRLCSNAAYSVDIKRVRVVVSIPEVQPSLEVMSIQFFIFDSEDVEAPNCVTASIVRGVISGASASDKVDLLADVRVRLAEICDLVRSGKRLVAAGQG